VRARGPPGSWITRGSLLAAGLPRVAPQPTYQADIIGEFPLLIRVLRWKITAPIEVSTADLATILGVTARRVAQLVEEKVLVRTARGMFDLGESVRSYMSYREGKLAAKLGAGPLYEAKRRYLEARARNSELDAQRRTGEMVPAAQIEASFAAVATAVRSALLAVPKACAARLGMTKGVVEAEALLREAIQEALSELSLTEVRIDGQA